MYPAKDQQVIWPSDGLGNNVYVAVAKRRRFDGVLLLFRPFAIIGFDGRRSANAARRLRIQYASLQVADPRCAQHRQSQNHLFKLVHRATPHDQLGRRSRRRGLSYEFYTSDRRSEGTREMVESFNRTTGTEECPIEDPSEEVAHR